MNCKVLALYLPQYHQIPENDEWWGEGFTEWTNVKKSKSLYPGHYQPRVPLNKNYYNLLDNDVMRKQAKMAKQHGIDGFCFYHYWFNGKKLLEKPVEMLLRDKECELEYCLSWANEPWTRTWDGIEGEKQVLINQNYGDEEDWKEHFFYLLPFFKDKRYIRIQGKPVFAIYKSTQIPKLKEMLEYWKKLACENGLNGIFFILTNRRDIHPVGIQRLADAMFDFEPMATMGTYHERYRVPELKRNFFTKLLFNKRTYPIYDYVTFCELLVRKKPLKQTKNYYGMFTGFDNSPRRGDKAGVIFDNFSPKSFEKYLDIQMKKSIEEGNELLFINAWNEWGEGAYLEPDERYGYAYLNAVKRVTNKYNVTNKVGENKHA